jgi:hypothetical protein
MTSADSGTRRTTVGWLAVGFAIALAVSWIGNANLARASEAALVVYLFGYVVGALLVEPRADRTTLALGVVRLVAGLLLTTVGFLLCLVLAVPWFAGPVGLFVVAVVRHRRDAFDPPRPAFTFNWDTVLTALVSITALSPWLIAAVRMAPGEFPPVFFNVDTPYFLEKVHALVTATTFPPESLSVVGGRWPYHYGVHGLAALIARSSGIAPGILGAAVVLARHLCPSLPSVVAVPMLLVSVPTLWYGFWEPQAPVLQNGPFQSVAGRWQAWGLTAIGGHNVAAHFLVLASLAGVVTASTRGWRLPVFLVGASVVFKLPTGIALVAGFTLAQTVRAAAARSVRPLIPAAAAAALFGVLYFASWVLPVSTESGTGISPLFYLKYLAERDRLLGFCLDAAWLLLPALIVLPALPASRHDRDMRRLTLLLFAAAPFIVVNVWHPVNVTTGIGAADDWGQIMLPVPLLAHAFVLSVAGARWTHLGYLRAPFLGVIALAVLPPVCAAARYSQLLIVEPQQGHEFADNRAIAEALKVIPTKHTVIVTNDLRYPAESFQRENRQMQIPALFGHQAFASNYAYESYDFLQERKDLQQLLSAGGWSDAIIHAARKHHWTHLLIRKDYAHPEPIPLELIFENDSYAVFRFGTS